MEMEASAPDRTVRRRLGAAAAVLGLLALAFVWRTLPVADALAALADRVRGTGATGMATYGAAYVGAELLALPLAPFTVGAGWAFGALLGAIVIVPATTVGATAAFALTRAFVRDPVRLAEGEGRVARALRLADRGGFRLVLLLRLSPLTPFSLLNFAFGATPMRARDFALATFLGTIPSALVYGFLGSLLSRPGDALPGGPWVAATAAAVTLAVAWAVRQRLAGEGEGEAEGTLSEDAG